MSTLPTERFSALIQRVQQRTSSVECAWASHGQWPLPAANRKHPKGAPLRVSVLDSSFNPPTLAHLALANVRPTPTQGVVGPSAEGVLAEGKPKKNDDFDAHLLLLSVRNADKSLKPSDATLVQRIEMMVALARSVHANEEGPANIAVAIIDEPTFVGKSRILREWLSHQISAMSQHDSDGPVSEPSSAAPARSQLTFLVGFDTLERLIATRYYGSEEDMLRALRTFLSAPPEGDDSYVICARRVMDGSGSEEAQKREKLTMAAAKEFIDSGRVRLIDLSTQERTFSSSEVREKINSGDPTWRHMTPATVAEYVEVNKLYRDPK
jgi:nicotinamide-nucleotide adenylyltransferase